MFTRFLAGLVCAGLTLHAADLWSGTRKGDLAEIRSALKSGANINAQDPDGATPLMYAALYASPECVRLLLERGANPNITNAAGATALIWASGNMEKVRLLVEHGADVNVQSKLGMTALLSAASHDGAGPIVSYLVAHGARLDVHDSLKGVPAIPIGGGGATPLIQAAKARDGEALSLFVAKGLDVNAKETNGGTALMNAIAYQNHANIKLLLSKGADVNAPLQTGATPLMMAAMRNDAETAALLIAKGAKVDAEDVWGNTAVMWAAYSELARPELVKVFLKAGADVTHKNKAGETALVWAQRRGATPVVDLLQGAREAKTVPVPVQTVPVAFTTPALNVSAAVEKTIAPLQKGGPAVFKQRGCVSCHNNLLPAVAISMAKGQGHAVDTQAQELDRKSLISLLKPAREMLFENGDSVPDIQVTAPYALMALAAQDYPADSITDAAVIAVANKQNADGSWTVWAPRPPIEYGDIQGTALGIRALQLYPLPGRQAEFEQRMRRAGKWLAAATPVTAEDANWKLLGLAWSKADRKVIAASERLVLDHQRPDGGWAQLSTLSSDAYATGQALYALHESGAVSAADPRWKKGIDYLLKTQQEDGTWQVKSRAFPFQPYFESGFPYGPDQWISMAGTGWASIVLSIAERKTAQMASLRH